jgi:hypothetical protein
MPNVLVIPLTVGTFCPANWWQKLMLFGTLLF